MISVLLPEKKFLQPNKQIAECFFNQKVKSKVILREKLN